MHKTLFTLAIPEFDTATRLWIDAIREEHGQKLEPHFTIGFGVKEKNTASYFDHVKNIARTTKSFDVCCRRVALGTDHRNDSGYAYLVVDEGNSEIYKLHDAMYSGYQESNLELNVPYFPHLTLAHFESLTEAKEKCDDLNMGNVTAQGHVGKLIVVCATETDFETVASFELQR